MEHALSAMERLAAEVKTCASLIVPADRHTALHDALDTIDSVLDSRHLKCGDCNATMSEADVLDHVCGGRYETLRCGDCGQPVDGARVGDHVCSTPVQERRREGRPSPPMMRRPPVFTPMRRPIARRRAQAPFSLEDVFERIQAMCLELRQGLSGNAPWWEVTTPEAMEALEAAVAGVRAVVDEQFLKCGDCLTLLTEEEVASHVCRAVACADEPLSAAEVSASKAKAGGQQAKASSGSSERRPAPIEPPPQRRRLTELYAPPWAACPHRPRDGQPCCSLPPPDVPQPALDPLAAQMSVPLPLAEVSKSTALLPTPLQKLVEFLYPAPQRPKPPPTATTATVVPAAQGARMQALAASVEGGGDAISNPSRAPHQPAATAASVPAARRRPWDAQEDHTICELVGTHGQDFEKVAAALKGRTPDAVRNRWNRLKGAGRLPDPVRGHTYRCAHCGVPKRGHRCSRDGPPTRPAAATRPSPSAGHQLTVQSRTAAKSALLAGGCSSQLTVTQLSDAAHAGGPLASMLHAPSVADSRGWDALTESEGGAWERERWAGAGGGVLDEQPAGETPLAGSERDDDLLRLDSLAAAGRSSPSLPLVIDLHELAELMGDAGSDERASLAPW